MSNCKKLLIVGNPNAELIKELVKAYRKKLPSLQIDCFALRPLESNQENVFDKIYNNSIFEWWTRNFKTRARIGWLLGVLLNLIPNIIQHARFDRYDVVQVQYVSLLHQYAMRFYRMIGKKIWIVFWGTDLFRCNRFDILETIVKDADQINCHTPELKQALLENLPNASLSKKNWTQCFFGLTPLELISEFKEKQYSKLELFNVLHIAPTDKKIIALGYNASSAQQHLKVIENLSDDFFSNAQIWLPMTYGNSSEYIRKVEKALIDKNADYVIIREFMTNEQVAALRMLTDILIQVQVSDSFSGSMQEHLYCGCLVITGSWLPYSTLIERGILMSKVDQISEIGGVITRAMSNFDELYENLQINPDIIESISKWDNVIDNWVQATIK
ncbi:hypothetical protein ACMZOO_14010 [Catenovulum sp. SX2]|uniref:hypothetical protein n=1 Tax=Catenovulum sp. SX2 TaxID=3398614 RepID=UPI003F84333C